MEDLKELMVDNMKDLFDAENQLLKAMPKISKAASSPELKKMFDTHLVQTRGQIQRLEKAFQALGEKPKGKHCAGMEGLIKEAQEVIEEGKGGDPDVLDAGLIVAAQKVEHYEMASYGSVREFANELGMPQVARLIDQILAEEKKTDQKLTQLAVRGLNQRAKSRQMQEKMRMQEERSSKGASKSASSKKSAPKKSSSSRSSSASASRSAATKSRSTGSSRSSASRSSSATKSKSSKSGSSSAGGSRKSSSTGGARKSSSSAKSSRSRSSGSSKSKSSGSRTSASSNITTDHDFIRTWAEERGGKPACVRGTGESGDIGILRIDFPGYSGSDSLEEISWDEFFEKFDERDLALVYQEETADGKKSNFNKLISRSGN